MTRNKVKLTFITNDSARKATYKKRKRGLLKKMDELTTLCDVKACAILYSPYETNPVVWPEPSGARDVIASFKRLPEMEKVKKMVNQEEFLRQRVAKAHEQLKRQQKDNREKEITQVMYECLSSKSIQNMSVLDLSDLNWVISQNLIEIKNRIAKLNKENPTLNNIITNHNVHYNTFNNNVPIDRSVSGLPPSQQGIGLGFGGKNLQENGGNYEAMEMQMVMQPWSSFMNMMGPIMAFGHQQPTFHGLGNGLVGGSNGEASSSSSYNNNMNMNIMSQFSDYQGNGINPTL